MGKRFIYIFFLFAIFFVSKESYANDSYYRTKVAKISKALILLKPNMKFSDAMRISDSIYSASEIFLINPTIMLMILSVESNFQQKAVSISNDISIAQINLKVWSKDTRLKQTKNYLDQIKHNETLAIYMMAEILSILKKEFAHKDSLWFVHYHSGTPEFRRKYIKNLDKAYQKIKSIKF